MVALLVAAALVSAGCTDRTTEHAESARRDSLLAQVHSATGLAVLEVQIARQRMDLSVAATGSADPDIEQELFDSAATHIWDDAQLRIGTETIAVAVTHPVRRDGSSERNTYFYYRSELEKRRRHRPGGD